MTSAFASFVRMDSLASWMFSIVFLFVSGFASAQGEVDQDFSPGTPNSTVHAIAEQGDGKILVGGSFITINGVSRRCIARIYPDGTFDEGFNPAVSASINAIVVQADGKILVGGTFTNINNIPRQRLARLNADGSVDLSFVADASSPVEAIALQKDGKILIGGQFTTVGGQSRSRIARLHPDGTVDADFNSGAENTVNTIALQTDGKILLGGAFSTIASTTRQRIARLHPDGSLDASFNPAPNDNVNTIAIQSDGKILVGGSFANIGGVFRDRIARLNSDGTVDGSFNPGSSGAILTCALQSDRKILVGGQFSEIAGAERVNLARLHADGTADDMFDPEVNNSVMAITLGADGKPYIGGSFTEIGGQAAPRLARLLNEPAISELAVEGTKQITWMRGGSAPEIEKVAFDYWDGLAWVDAGPVVRIAGGWHATGLSLPSSTWVRATGLALGGRHNASTGLVRELFSYGGAAFPKIEVRLDGDALVPGRGLAEFGTLNWKETSAPRVLTIRNVGDAPLTGISASISGVHAPEFTMGAFSDDSLPPGGEVSFDVFFSPIGGGVRGADLQITSNDAERSPYRVRLLGIGILQDDTFSAFANNPLHAISIQENGKILLGGTFTTFGGTSRSYLVRIHPDGAIDDSFQVDVPGAVNAIVIQPDGKILLGGQFYFANGIVRQRLARLNADSTLDMSFAPQASGTVHALALQPDGGILLGGQFASMSGISRERIARLHPDGSLDEDFNPGATGTVNAIAVQADGKILLGGAFANAGGSSRSRFARLHPDGTIDTSFNPGPNGTVNTIAIQPDGKILIGGDFDRVSGVNRQRMARLHPGGGVDGGFSADCSGTVNTINTIALQADGRIHVGGQFATIGGVLRASIARLNPDGSPDAAYDPWASGIITGNSTVNAITLDLDGKPIVGGTFASIGGAPATRIARLQNDPASADLSVDGTAQITWMRGGSSAEITNVRFEYWDGDGWVDAGPAGRIEGGWRATGLALPSSSWIRASGTTSSGRHNASSSITSETTAYGGGALPQIEIRLGGKTLMCGTLVVELEPTAWRESSAPLTLTIHNTGNSPLAGLAATLSGAHALEFSLGELSEDPLPPGGQTSLEITFNPIGGGLRNASLQITSNDGNHSPFRVLLAGTGLQHDPGFALAASNSVFALATQGDGRILMGGTFSSAGGVARSRLARILSDGTVDAGFQADANDLVTSIAIQPDGKILLGGLFTNVNGVPRFRIARLHPDGSLDEAFAPMASGRVNAVIVQSDGGIVVAGQFQNISGVPRVRIARLHPDGSLDPDFNPGADSTVNTLALQNDGKILLGGVFYSTGGDNYSRLARLHPDGVLDTAFRPSPGATVNTITVQPDGKILVGGQFTSIGGASRTRIARLHPDGTADEGFHTSSSDTIRTFALQADGKILLGGEFTFINGILRNHLARLNYDGTLDGTFDPAANNTVFALALDADGRTLAGGSFTKIGGVAAPYVARLPNDVAHSALSVGGTEQITWTRGGAAPELENVSLDAWSGSSWIGVGPAGRVTGGWQTLGLALPASGWLRVRGSVAGGDANASTGWVEEILAYGEGDFPSLGVSAQERALAPLGDAVDFGEIVWLGDDAVIRFTITNHGDSPLENLAVSPGGPDAGMFAVEALATTSLAPGESTTFDVVLSSMANGEVVATLAIASNDAGTGPFEVVLRGIVARTDPDFAPQADNSVFALAPQADGKVVVAGNFTEIHGIPRERIARIHANGELDAPFNASADGWIYALAIQADGKIVIGGDFTTVNGQPRVRIARLHADGSLDESFSPEVLHGEINSIAIQHDGKIVFAGNFSHIGEVQRLRIARLHPDGSLDEDYNPTVNQRIRTLVLQDDGKILIGGFFTLVGGVERERIARLHPDGSLDGAFDPSVPGNWRVNAFARQPDGKIIVAGQFTFIGGVSRQNLARIHDDGTVDITFDAPTNNWIDTVSIQADGKILLGGEFSAFNGQLRSRIARLLVDGSVDPTFDPGADGWINGISLQADGAILAVGTFTQISGQPRQRIARLRNEPATPQLSVTNDGVIQWTPGGAMPVPNGVSVEYQDGSEWVGLGEATRVPSGWQLATSPLPVSGELRFICRTSGGRFCGSNGFITVRQSYDGYATLATFATWPVLASLPPNRRGKFDTNGPLDLPNILAYAMALDPLTATAADMPALAGASDEPGRVMLRFRRNTLSSDTALAIQVSLDLAEDSWMPAVWNGITLVEAGSGWEVIEAEVETPDPLRGFFRLRVNDLDH